ncbi:MAG: L-seryl-tRNA(Sec) selenium transferase [Deltaproteobacteria bacterium]|nr:L-seryl-tRNA(Sec) selenium transferase [Deltaproteobacteria bacterium]
MMKSLRDIPSVHELLKHPPIQMASQKLDQKQVVGIIRLVLEDVRSQVYREQSPIVLKEIHQEILQKLSSLESASFKRVINATGVLIHTNLGRAPLSKKALARVTEVAGGYSTLEFNLEKASRGDRNDAVEGLLCLLTGAEAACVVNNNAAALFLCLNSLSFQQKTVVSRSELVEIGSSFRLPDILEKSGALLKEVGTTNKTKVSDYEKALDKNTPLILKVHKSNFDIVGFTEEVSLEELSSLARRRKKVLLFDAGSGLLRPWPGLEGEPVISDCVRAGVDLMTFSGDKLLGGPQSGLIVGKKKWISLIKQNPLYRALRIDKLVLATLEETLRHYFLDHPEAEIPFLKLYTTPQEVLRIRAEKLKCDLEKEFPLDSIHIEEAMSKIGGGAFPRLEVPTIILSFDLPKEQLLRFEKNLRSPGSSQLSVIGRIQKNRFIVDLRTIFEEELWFLKNSFSAAYQAY